MHRSNTVRPLKRLFAKIRFTTHKHQRSLLPVVLISLLALPLLTHRSPTCFPPTTLYHFDPSAQQTPTSIFSTFSQSYILNPFPSHILNLSETSPSHLTDIPLSLAISQNALRTYFRDSSLRIHRYSLGYSHLDRLLGARFVFHLQTSTRCKRRATHVVAIQYAFAATCRVQVRSVDTKVIVYLLVPYSNRPKRLQWFLSHFDSLVLQATPLRLILAVCQNYPNDIQIVTHLISTLHHKHLIHLTLAPPDSLGRFSRSISILHASAHVPSNDIMFIVDIDMYIYPTMITNCILNTVLNHQVYFPVFYSLYPRKDRIEPRAGYWRQSSYGMSCMHRSDFDRVHPYANTSFVGWGGEDVALYQAFRNHPSYYTFRAIEPALRHKWHLKKCDPTTSEYKSCLNVRFQQIGDIIDVGGWLMKQGIDIQALLQLSQDALVTASTNAKLSNLQLLGPKLRHTQR